jgi:hypothetical protein
MIYIELVILSEASRSFIARGTVEEPVLSAAEGTCGLLAAPNTFSASLSTFGPITRRSIGRYCLTVAIPFQQSTTPNSTTRPLEQSPTAFLNPSRTLIPRPRIPNSTLPHRHHHPPC